MSEANTKLVEIIVNGEPRSLEPGTSVASLLVALRIPREGVAVERNRAVVRRADHASTALEQGDVVEIVRFVGGG